MLWSVLVWFVGPAYVIVGYELTKGDLKELDEIFAWGLRMSTRWIRWFGLGVPALLLDTAGQVRATTSREPHCWPLEAESDEEE